jgi:hypothetical protein
MGKQADANLDADWGSIRILIFATGTEMPAAKPALQGNVPANLADRTIPIEAVAAPKP